MHWRQLTDKIYAFIDQADIGYYVGYACGPTTEMKDKSCKMTTGIDLTTDDTLDAPCKSSSSPLANCPTTGSSVNVTKCYCDRRNLCNFSNNIQPNIFPIIIISVFAVLLPIKFN